MLDPPAVPVSSSNWLCRSACPFHATQCLVPATSAWGDTSNVGRVWSFYSLDFSEEGEFYRQNRLPGCQILAVCFIEKCMCCILILGNQGHYSSSYKGDSLFLTDLVWNNLWETFIYWTDALSRWVTEFTCTCGRVLVSWSSLTGKRSFRLCLLGAKQWCLSLQELIRIHARVCTHAGVLKCGALDTLSC